MKKGFLILLVIMCAWQSSLAQKVTPSAFTTKIDNIDHKGMVVYLELDFDKVRDAWKKQLKDYGKVESDKSVYTLPVANIPAVSNTPIRILSKVEKSGKGVMVWWTIDKGSEYLSPGAPGWDAAVKILHDFGVQAYVDDINEQIKDAEKALSKSVKDQEKTIKTGENLKSDHEKNAKEKITLEQKLKDNAQEKIDLEKSIEQNKLDQAQSEKNVENMKKAVELVRSKLGKVE